jgi:hypothetical protein
VKHPTAGHLVKALGETAYTVISMVVEVNPIVTTVVVIGDLTGLTDRLFDW